MFQLLNLFNLIPRYIQSLKRVVDGGEAKSNAELKVSEERKKGWDAKNTPPALILLLHFVS